jgi:ribonuclease BN (tRNA processing enzyme)
LIALKRANIDPNDIDTILISHLHGDHFGGIPFFVLDGQFSRRSRRMLFAGPPGLSERSKQAMEVMFPGSSRTERKFEVEFLELAEGSPTTLGPVRVTPYEVTHASGGPPYAFRVELGGRTIAYSQDIAQVTLDRWAPVSEPVGAAPGRRITASPGVVP